MVCLLEDRVMFCLLFLYVGVDMFGLWVIVYRRIRGSLVNQKWWVLLFICMVIRVIYIEVIEELFSVVFINVLRCFIVIRGLVVQFRFDCGINFIGVIQDLFINVEFVEKGFVGIFLFNLGQFWIFNLFYVFYMGGVWECLIGVLCRIFDFMLFQN